MSHKVSAKEVGELRRRTNAGLIDCKKALVEAEGDMEAAIVILKKKGIASAAKKAGREASEGIVESYIHMGGRVGVLIELNCETDFVAKNEAFKALARDIAMHIAAIGPQYLNAESVPAEILEKEREIARSQCEGKPAAAIDSIIEGKVKRFCKDNCLLNQPYVKNSSQTVQEFIAENIAALAENIVIKQFSRFEIGG